MIKTSKIIFALVFSGMLLLSSCAFQCLDGSGEVITEERPAEAIHSIVMEIPGKLILHQGDTGTIKIKADENLMPLLETTLASGVLKITASKCIGKYSSLEIHAGLNELRSVENSGSGTITGETGFKGDVVKLRQTGSGDISLEIKANTVIVRQTGSGEIALKGNAQEQNVEVSGSGDYNASGFKTGKTQAEVSGSGSCDLWVEKELDATVSGSGDIRYKGGPKQVSSKVTGSGAIKSRED